MEVTVTCPNLLIYAMLGERKIMEFESVDRICQNKSFIKPDTPVYIKPLQNHTDNKTTDLLWIHSGKTVQTCGNVGIALHNALEIQFEPAAYKYIYIWV